MVAEPDPSELPAQAPHNPTTFCIENVVRHRLGLVAYGLVLRVNRVPHRGDLHVMVAPGVGSRMPDRGSSVVFDDVGGQPLDVFETSRGMGEGDVEGEGAQAA